MDTEISNTQLKGYCTFHTHPLTGVGTESILLRYQHSSMYKQKESSSCNVTDSLYEKIILQGVYTSYRKIKYLPAAMASSRMSLKRCESSLGSEQSIEQNSLGRKYI